MGHEAADVIPLAAETAALRRIAGLVASGAPAGAVLATISEQLARGIHPESAPSFEMTGVLRFEPDDSATVVAQWSEGEDYFPPGSNWPLDGDNAPARVFRTGRPARIEDSARPTGALGAWRRAHGATSGTAAPLVVEGRLWGCLYAITKRAEGLPADAQDRIADFAELVTAAIASAQASAEARRLAREQTALRRVATLAAEGAPPAQVLDAVAGEILGLLELDETAADHAVAVIVRFEADATMTVVADRSGKRSPWPLGSRVAFEGDDVVTRVVRTGRSARLDRAVDASWRTGGGGRATGAQATVAVPITVDRRLWGAACVLTADDRDLPPETEANLAEFAELAATAISSAQSRAEAGRLAEEQAALRRVATLVSRQPSPNEVFAAVAEELGVLLGADASAILRYEAGPSATAVAGWSGGAIEIPVGRSIPIYEGDNVADRVLRTGRPQRMDDWSAAEGPVAAMVRALGVRSSVAGPVIVDGRIWGMIGVLSQRSEALPPDTEARIVAFSRHSATAIANAHSRDELNASRARLLTAGDEARRRLVRDLHDGAQQRLVHTIVTLKLAQRSLRQNDGRTESLIGEALAHAEQGQVELRDLARGILPAVLTLGGLRAGVGSLIARLDLPVDLELTDERFTAEFEASAYFIVAEALTNVVKHARAARAVVRAAVEGATLRVEVRDDGIGGADPAGPGLEGLGDRVTALGGKLELDSPPGGGTLVAATLPIAARS